MTALEEIVIWKNELRGERSGVPRDTKLLFFPGDEKVSDHLSAQYHQELVNTYGEGTGYWIWMAMNEAMINFREHAHHNDPKKTTIVYSWHDDGRVYFTFGGEGEGFDPRNAYSTAKERDEKENCAERKRGHILMNFIADYIQYTEYGKSMMMIIDIEQLERRLEDIQTQKRAS